MTELTLYIDMGNINTIYINILDLYVGIGGPATALQSDSVACSRFATRSRFALASTQCSSSVERLFVLRRAAEKITRVLPAWNVRTDNATHSHTTLHPPLVLCVEWQDDPNARASQISALASDPRYIALCAARDLIWKILYRLLIYDSEYMYLLLVSIRHQP